jgi:hypothetical protein
MFMYDWAIIDGGILNKNSYESDLLSQRLKVLI